MTETVSGRDSAATANETGASGADRAFDIRQDGVLGIEGPGGRDWQISVTPDEPPRVTLLEEGARTTFDGQMSRPFEASDDYRVTGGTAVFRLDRDRVDRRHGLKAEPDPREPIELDLPMPITGDGRSLPKPSSRTCLASTRGRICP